MPGKNRRAKKRPSKKQIDTRIDKMRERMEAFRVKNMLKKR